MDSRIDIGEQIPQKAKREFIGKGIDSSVFRENDSVIKIYSPYVSLEEVTRYMDVTNKAAKLLAEKELTGKIKLSETSIPFRVWANPVKDVYFDNKENSVIGVSEFVQGLRMRELEDIPLKNLGVERVYKGGQARIEEEAFLKGLRRIIGNDLVDRALEESIFHSAKYKQVLYPATRFISANLNANGIDIVSENVKVKLSEDGYGLDFIITDLCASIGDLK